VDGGAAILRVHDVSDAREFLTVRAALNGDVDVPEALRLDATLRREPA
jgi:dihydropteroate synthase